MTMLENEGKRKQCTIFGIAKGYYMSRPDCDEVWLLDYEPEGFRILWPEGMTAKQAILQWAKQQIE